MLRPALVAASFLLFAPLAHATWQEAHESADDIRVEVGPDGSAVVEHHLRYRIVAGKFKTFELVGIDPRGQLSPEASFQPEKGGAETPARVEAVAKTPGNVKISIDEGKGLGRGTYVITVKYKIDLVAAKMLQRDGAMWKVMWTAPPAPEGHDGARLIFDVPSAPTEPRLAGDASTTLATLRRLKERDELELVRAHVPRGEAVAWTARVDPRAFPSVTTPDLRPPRMPELPPSLIGTNLSRILVALGLATLIGSLSLLLRAKQRGVRELSASRGLVARPLVPLKWATPYVYGVVTTVAFGVLLWSTPIVGAILVALAMALAAHRSPLLIAKPRQPGEWKPLAETQLVKARVPSDRLHVANRFGQLVLLGIVVVVAAVAILLRTHVPQLLVALPLASAALLPIFVTGQMLASPTELAAGLLRPARDALAKAIDLSHVDIGAIGRVVKDGSVDEVRLACTPKERTPGLDVIEVALATCPGGHGAVPEVFIRFEHGSPAAQRVARLKPFSQGQVVVGRRSSERVFRIAPEEPTGVSAAALVGALLMGLEDRRTRTSAAPQKAWRGPERRRFRPVLAMC